MIDLRHKTKDQRPKTKSHRPQTSDYRPLSTASCLLSVVCCLLPLVFGCVPPPEVKEELELEVDSEISESKKYYSFGREYLKNKMYDEAIKSFNRAIEESTSYVDAYINLGLAYKAKRDYVEMERVYKELLKVTPAKGHYALGGLYTEEKKYAEALTHYKEALKADTAYVDALYGLGFVYEKMGNPGAAIKEYEQALEFDPKNESIRYSLAKAYIAIEQYEHSIKELKTLRDAHPDDLDVRLALGGALLAIKSYTEARAEFEYITGRSPSDITSRVNLGLACENLKDYECAAQSYKSAISIDTTNISSYYHLINFYIKLNRLIEASKFLNIARRLDLNNQILYCLSGDIRAEQGSIAFKNKEFDTAISEFKIAISEYKSALKGESPEWVTYADKAIKRVEAEFKRAEEEKWWR